MGKIDAHQHFWKFNPLRDSWITEEMGVIRRDFFPEDLEPLLKEHGFEGCVVVQSDQSEAENHFQLSNAAQHPFIKGVVGWVDLQADNVEDRLAHYKSFDKLKGFRHVLQGESDRALMLRPQFKRGISKLKSFGYTYDILIYPDQLKFTEEFVAQFPDQPFVIDHMAKPYIKKQDLEDWKGEIKAIAQFENVYCKVSGMVTEAHWQNWKKEDFIPYLEVVLEAFGPRRLMFGSDWPVCLVAASYQQVLGLVEDYFATCTSTEQALIFGETAAAFYQLQDIHKSSFSRHIDKQQADATNNVHH